MKAQNFTLPTSEGNISLSDYNGKKLVLYFYPKDDTPGCTLEALDFTKNITNFKDLNTVVLGISPDPVEKHCKFQEKHKLKVILASDEDKKVMTQYGVWGKKKFMGREYMGVIRTTLLIGPDGDVLKKWDNVKVKGHVEEVLRFLTELKK